MSFHQVSDQPTFHQLLGMLLNALLKPGHEESIYFLFTPEQAAKVWQIVNIFYTGSNSMSVSFYYATESYIAFKVYSRNHQSFCHRKPVFDFLGAHEKRIRELFVEHTCKATDEDIDFIKSYFNVEVKVA